MKIALLTYSSKPRGGVVHTLALAEALARAGQDVSVWSLGRGGDSEFFRKVDPAVTVRMVPFSHRENESVGERILRSIGILRQAFTPDEYDIVHAQDCISANAVGRCIRTIHHLDEFITPELAACHERAITAPYARICVSTAVADDVRRGWGLDPVVIPNGVDAGRFSAAAESGRSHWSGKFGRYVLAVGGIEPRKGSLDLLDAFAGLSDRTVQLVFAGGETLFDYRDYRSEFDRRAVELGIEPVILGTVDDDELPHLVAQAAVLPFFSTKEGFGLAAMEALAASTPVVARDLPVLREVFGDSVTYASSVETMTSELDRALHEPQDPSPGLALAHSLTWDEAARRHLEFYSSLR
ncbi:MSMEG_0565 family glycosyltransferase [Rhodococcus fascians]|uniref:MSMEG_0565 family glycosyltransferase n=1 Tax=Rhodococcoides fascians TaxID=1828 RepID=UPI00196124B0|nr:MSMEG_0565 family glycosyltransferase [Rhodococcus fascians]MBM7246295.1 MSMEG_0565 family glycosyltransferase [Rhodococcus fascians]MBY3811652.1 MSMEG_0565 family glycosyltransferase [Rhodococcus fascians]MBY3843155.1 MSMEG_0565 family glycosyltransferase [Rhodococcus fascians]MBY3848315.1 MSMEG_0565 family glycosyltransferase [Rhodococcus fascians]MBY3852324.1 MSMEG_0565 family glycosyltransferase [Rhodococcus fascians]